MPSERTPWLPVAVILTGINLMGLGYAVAAAEPAHAAVHVGLALAFGYWARRLRRRHGGGELSRQNQQLADQSQALTDVQNALASQSSELAELHERVDFVERLLAQIRERPPLANPRERG